MLLVLLSFWRLPRDRRQAENILPRIGATCGWSCHSPGAPATIWERLLAAASIRRSTPIYMLMLIRRLAPDFIVWDKAARIEFLKPGRETLHARFVINDAELAAIRAALNAQRSVDRSYIVELTDASGTVCARVEKFIYIRRRESTSTKS